MEAARPDSRKVEVATRYSWFVVLVGLGGWALANVDGSFFTFAFPLIMEEFKFGLEEVGYLYTIAFGVGGVASILLGPTLDYFGRKRVFQLTLIGTTVGSLLSAISWGYLPLVAFRSIAQAGATTEWFAGQAITAEEMPAKQRGWMMSIVQSGWPVGWFIAALISLVVLPTLGWRWLFVVGIIPMIVVLIARRWLREPPRAEDVARLRKEAEQIALKKQEALEEAAREVTTQFEVAKEKAVEFTWRQLFGRDLVRTSTVIGLYLFLMNVSVGGLLLWMPAIVIGLGYTPVEGTLVVAYGSGAAIVAYLVQGLVGDRIGRKETILMFLVPGMASLYFFAYYAPTLTHVIVFWTIGYFFIAGTWSCIMGLLMEAYPTRARGTGAGFVTGLNWLGLMAVGIIGPIFLVNLGMNNSIFVMDLIVFVSWILLFFMRRIPGGQRLEEIIT